MSRINVRDNALIFLSSIFFVWGLITVVSNSLIPYYKEAFSLDYRAAMLFPMAFFITRVLISLPTSFIMEKIGYKTTLKYCLYLCFTGCLAMAYFVRTEQLELTLVGIFLIASGVTAIQVVSSPYVSLISTPEHSVRRQSIATASNSIGTVLGPIVLSMVIVVAAAFGVVNTGQQISIIFLVISLVFLGQIVCFRFLELPDIKLSVNSGFWKGLHALLKHPHFLRFPLVLLLCIGVEVSFGTFTITYLAEEEFGGLGLVSATQLIAGYWIFMFLGRFFFARYGHRINSNRLFTAMCSLAIVICLIATQVTNVIVGYLLLLVGLCNSTLYPIIYAQALKAAGEYRSQGAALLIMCSIGGAILPLVQAILIDNVGLSTSYWVPAVSYAAIIWIFIDGLKRNV